MHRSASGWRPSRAVAAGVALVAALLPAGCATGPTDNPFEGRGGRQVRVHVVNNTLQDVTVYALAPALRERLGRITSNDTERFTMRWPHTRELRLELDFLAGRTCFSHPVMVSPGDEVEVILQPSMTRLDCR